MGTGNAHRRNDRDEIPLTPIAWRRTSKRGFRLDASRSETAWLEMNNGSGDASVSSLAIKNPHLVFVVACAGHGRWRHGLLDTSNVCR